MRASQVNVGVGLNAIPVEQMVAYTAKSVKFDFADVKLLVIHF